MFWKERHTRIFLAEMFCIFALAAVTGLLLTGYRENRMQNLLFWHDAAIASSLLEQGIEKEAVATALLSDKSLVRGRRFYTRSACQKTRISVLCRAFISFVLQKERESLCAAHCFLY